MTVKMSGCYGYTSASGFCFLWTLSESERLDQSQTQVFYWVERNQF